LVNRREIRSDDAEIAFGGEIESDDGDENEGGFDDRVELVLTVSIGL